MEYLQQDDPFKEAEDQLGIKLHYGTKKIFMANGFDNKKIIARINEEDILNTEEFVRNTLVHIVEENEYAEYFGIFKNNVSKFKLLDGYKKQLRMIIEFYKKQNDKILNSELCNSRASKSTKDKSNVLKKNVVEENESGDMKVLTSNLPEEKKIIERNITEWIKQKINKNPEQNFNIDSMKNINITVSLNLDECDDDMDNSSISNSVHAIIECYCGSRTKVLKKITSGHKKPKWILGNYYRHLVNPWVNHSEPKQSEIRKTEKKNSKNVQQNTVKNYFTTTTSQKINKDVWDDGLNDTPIIPVINNLSPEVLKGQISDNPSKWKDPKYSRSQRDKRARENNLFVDGEKQLLITNFYEVVDHIKIFVNENDTIFNDSIKDFEKTTPAWKKTQIEKIFKKTSTNVLLNALCKASLNNSGLNNKHGNRYDESLKQFCVFLYFVGGRLLYETLQANLTNSLPSLTTLNRFISSSKDIIIEGEYRFEKLKEFLVKYNLPLCVWISEDATRITGKIEYDSINNKIVGFVMPFDKGVAKSNAFLATSAYKIGKYFQTNIKAEYAYIIMAKPLQDSAPTFCLSIYGTDNRFNYSDVINRWEVMNKLSRDAGISILGYSSDGDTRLLKAMQIKTFANLNVCMPYYIQDTVHIGTKLRTRFIKSDITLPIGNYMASVSHLKMLIQQFSKDKHLLTTTDICPEDKMNFRSAEKICSPIVTDLLNNIPDSQGTVAFLKVMNSILTSFLNKSITVEDRIYRIWYGLYFLRIWRYSISKNKNYTLKNNFITTNSYSCIELNAHTLILIIKKFRDNNYTLRPSMFMPWFYSSQVCEELFRSARSMTSTFSTIINFSMNDILKRLTRIQLLNHIQNDLHKSQKDILHEFLSSDDTNTNSSQVDKFVFPRLEKHNRNFINSTQINDAENNMEKMDDTIIDNILSRSKKDATEMATSLGIQIYEDSLSQPQYLSNSFFQNENQDKNSTENTSDMNEDMTFNNINILKDDEIPDDVCKDLSKISDFGNFGNVLCLKDFSISDKFLNSISTNKDEISQTEFVRITLDDATSMVVKKSSLCWLFDNNNKKISNDRLRRFINFEHSEKKTTKKRNIEEVPTSKEIVKSKTMKKKAKKQFFQENNLEKDSEEDCEDDVNLSEICDDDISLDESFHDNENIKEVEYQKPDWNDIKPGTYLLVQFKGGNRKKTTFKYVCCVSEIDSQVSSIDERVIQVQGMINENLIEKNEFSMKENEVYNITFDMVLAILPEPTLIQKNRKLIYTFPGSIAVNEK